MILWPGIHSTVQKGTKNARRGQQDRRASSDNVPVNGDAPMVENLKPEVKGKPVRFIIGDATDRLSVAFAMKQGYRIVLDGDGEGEISNPANATYYISKFACSCPDKLGRGGSYEGGWCKHAIWLSQLRPCEKCGGVMLLGEFRTAFGETARLFECPCCGNARQLDLVRQERRALRNGKPQEEALTSEGRCRQAIAWMKTRVRSRYVWYVVDQSPELAPVMVRLLIEEGEGKLADAIAARYEVGVKVA